MKQFFSFLLFSLLVFPFLTEAQIGVMNQNISINTAPAFPEPYTETTVSLDAYTYDTTGASITWYVDGVENTAAKNNRSFTLTTKGVGENTEVRVDITLLTGQIMSETIIIKPIRIDIVVEADTLVPPFYKGRALPTTGSQARLIATPHTGQETTPNSLTYLWKHDNQVLFGGPIKGGQVADIEVGMGREQIITVDVINNNGQSIGRKSIVLPLAQPEVLFYEDNPLRGASQIAIFDPYYITGDEVNLKAEPYYMDSDILSANSLIEWEINGRKVKNVGSDPQYLNLTKGEKDMVVRIGFQIRNLSNLLQGIKEEFVLHI